MELNKAIKILTVHQKWRRGDEELPATNPKELGIAIDTILEHFKKTVTIKAKYDDTTLKYEGK